MTMVDATALGEAELRSELERRGLASDGARDGLVQRLQQALDDELLAEEPAAPPPPPNAGNAEGGAALAAEAAVADDSDDDDENDGISFTLRNVSEMEKLMESGKPMDVDGLAGAGDADEEADGDEHEVPAEDELPGDEPKFKYSHGKSKKWAPLPGRAGTINEKNYVQYAVELGKRNTPFEVDLDHPEMEKPWTRYNSSLDDYFNFGLNEQTWREFAARQVALRIHHLDKGKDDQHQQQ